MNITGEELSKIYYLNAIEVKAYAILLTKVFANILCGVIFAPFILIRFLSKTDSLLFSSIPASWQRSVLIIL